MKKRRDLHRSMAVSVVLMAALFLLPLVVVAPFREEVQSAPPPAGEETLPAPQTEGGDKARRVQVLHEGSVKEMDLGTYLEGVLRAEMPASFSPEALKAQTVAARTYTLYKLSSGGNHGDEARICTDPACCQAWMDEETARAKWGAEAETYEKKVETAVRETDGEVILYDGEPILAVFHAASAGKTRAAEDVWSGQLPYLQPVDSPELTERIPDYYSRAAFQKEEFRRLAKAAWPGADLSGEMAQWLKEAVTDESGSVVTVEIGGECVRGSEVRSVLGLRSACFTWEAEGDALVFFVTGYGHGVGMSQYGAEAMAAEGADHRQILTHYYTGTTVGRWP